MEHVRFGTVPLQTHKDIVAPVGGTEFELLVHWLGWNLSPGQFRHGYFRGFTEGGVSSPNMLFSIARAKQLRPPREGGYDRHIVTAVRVMNCNRETQRWEYEKMRMLYSRKVCTEDGDCLDYSTYLPEPTSNTFSSCMGIKQVCGGEEGSVTFTVPATLTSSHGRMTATLGQRQCSEQFNGFNPFGSPVNGLPNESLFIEGGTGPGQFEGQPCRGGARLAPTIYSIELSECTTPDQLVGQGARNCEAAMQVPPEVLQ